MFVSRGGRLSAEGVAMRGVGGALGGGAIKCGRGSVRDKCGLVDESLWL